jgi:hypothetical protein
MCLMGHNITEKYHSVIRNMLKSELTFTIKDIIIYFIDKSSFPLWEENNLEMFSRINVEK